MYITYPVKFVKIVDGNKDYYYYINIGQRSHNRTLKIQSIDLGLIMSYVTQHIIKIFQSQSETNFVQYKFV